MIKKSIAYFFATCCGLGYVPWAPGTIASIFTASVIFVVAPSLSSGVAILLLSTVLVIALWSAGVVERCGSKVDPSHIVIDEVVGMALALAAIPVEWGVYLVALVAFRFFDIYKPLLVAYVEKKFSGGLGIVADDIVAGLMARGVVGIFLFCIEH